MNILFKRQHNCYLEITPLATTLKTLPANSELLTILHTLALPQKSLFPYLFTQKKTYSLELVATKNQGVRYILCIPQNDVVGVKKSIYSFLPGILIQNISDYLPIKNGKLTTSEKWWGFNEMKLSSHFAYPLSQQTELTQHDSIAFLTGAMTKLQQNDLIVTQLVISPVSQYTHKKVLKIIAKLNSHLNEDYVTTHLLTKKHPFIAVLKILFLPVFLPFFLIKLLFRLLLDLLFLPLLFILFLSTFGKSRLFPFLFPVHTHERLVLTARQKETYQAISNKLRQELFEVSLRFFIVSDNKTDVPIRMKSLCSSLATFTTYYQSFATKTTPWFIHKVADRINFYRLKNRIHGLNNNPIMSIEELANLYHLPYTDTVKTEGLQKVKSKTLPVPINTINNSDSFACIVGKNNYADVKTAIGLTKEERARHMYILGATGTGKSTMLRSLIHNDLHQGQGFCVIDPHGDLVEKVLGDVPVERIQDVVFFNPFDIQHPIGLNLLELSGNVTGIEREREKDLIASSLISVFSKLYPPASWGHRMEYILRVATLTALTTPEPTLFTIQRLLIEYQYRKAIVDKLTDPVLHLFWKNEFAGLGNWQRAAMVTPVTNKLGRFLSSPHSRYILGQKHSTIDFTGILDKGKILLCDLSKGKIGEDTSTLFGAFLTAKIQLAAMKRVMMSEEQRRSFYLYIDEFQNFATPTFAQIMSESRKYGLHAILAHQTIAQIADQDLVKVILANTGTVICFRTGSPLDEQFILPYFKPLVENGEIANLSNYKFYVKINAIEPTDAFSGESIAIETKPDELTKLVIKDFSRKKYTVPVEQVEQEINSTYFHWVQEQLVKKATRAKKKVEAEEKKRQAELEKFQNGEEKNGVNQTNGVSKNGKVN